MKRKADGVTLINYGKLSLLDLISPFSPLQLW